MNERSIFHPCSPSLSVAASDTRACNAAADPVMHRDLIRLACDADGQRRHEMWGRDISVRHLMQTADACDQAESSRP